MAEEVNYTRDPRAQNPEDVEVSDRGLFDFAKKNKEEEHKPHNDEAISSEFHDKVKVDDGEKEGFLAKLHRSDSSSSSSSEEEEIDENGEKRKKKKGLKEKIKEKIKKEDDHDTSVPVEKPEYHPEEKNKIPVEETAAPPPVECCGGDHGKEKKGFLEKIKEKIPGYHPKCPEEKEKAKEGGNY